MEPLKVVIFCGGAGTRIKEYTDHIPKPMVPVGNKPLLWHIMKIYSHQGFKDFILCLGYRAEAIKEYFLNYEWLHHDFTMRLGDRHNWTRHTQDDMEDWSITFAFTGEESLTARRLAMVRKYLEDDKRFMVTYGDGVADVDLHKLLEFHKASGKIATITGAHPTSKYGLIQATENRLITGFQQKPQLSDYINIGFAVFEKDIFKFLKGKRVYEVFDKDVQEYTDNRMIEDVFFDLIEQQNLTMFQHEGFFHPLDTYKDYEYLNALWKQGKAPWKIWA